MLKFNDKETADCWCAVFESWGCFAIVTQEPATLGSRWEVIFVEPST